LEDEQPQIIQPEPYFSEKYIRVFIIKQPKGPPIFSLLGGHLGSTVVDYSSLLSSIAQNYPSDQLITLFPLHHLQSSEALLSRSYHHSYCFSVGF
jgi:hypothetical protein